ncbi:uncharacterized protein At5g23160 [Ziziphus jujuba]|uniref:Uncharacterized protein At5g23160 n=1 Tax=Ziziphus jujuba TaxID=326968 RepID=A0A6P3YXE0_ZIZJJ|nr:uncharacterized protein At5g23160 [Ziziphus jujuba]
MKLVNEGVATQPTVTVFKLSRPCLTCPSPLLLSPRMAEINNKTHHQSSKSRTTPYFLRCFGFSRKVPNKKIRSFSVTVRSEDAKKKKKTWWFSWSRLHLKNSTIKTVPVDTTTAVSEKPITVLPPDSKVQPSKSKSKSKKDKLITLKPKVPTNQYSQPPSEIEVVVAANPDQAPNIEKPLQIRYSPAGKHSCLRRLNSSNDDDDNNTTGQKRLSFGRKIEALRTGFQKTRSPEVNNSPRSSPSPPKWTSVKGVGTLSTKKIKSDPRKNVGPTIKYDSVVGMSVIMVTLVILFLWGRLCAILCTSAWFYFVPRFRSVMANDNRVFVETTPTTKKNPETVDFNSGEYKKKVVLEGFLERTRRSPS